MSKFIKSFEKGLVPFKEMPEPTWSETQKHLLNVVEENKWLLAVMLILSLLIKIL